MNLSLLGSVEITTRLDGAEKETFSSLTLADLDLLGMLNDESVGYIVVDTTEAFDEVSISLGGINLLSQLDVNAVCASPDAL